MLKILIVDDEPLARENLCVLLQPVADIIVAGECENAVEALGAINRLRPDVVFLDIHMPRISGLELVGMIDPERMPHIVFLTAYDEYALQAFEENAFDYLLKPVQASRLEKTLHRLRQHLPAQNVSALMAGEPDLALIPCCGQNRIYLLSTDEVIFVSSRVSGVFVNRADGSECFTELTLRTLESRTPLLRCHRQYLINMQHLREIRFDDCGLAELVMKNEVRVPVSRRYLKALKSRLGL
ncbi:two-component system response regulator BtsR [Rahnella sp. Larv3_ips]|uniref:two-component system response regulator BtsR n=1 Tax=Rahnella sp. Larv3_ips TaxID=1896943 RepID=UPI000EFBED9C|nr:two-component system response regulator BtsR [Rahnella sp. Larv3_ips]